METGCCIISLTVVGSSKDLGSLRCTHTSLKGNWYFFRLYSQATSFAMEGFQPVSLGVEHIDERSARKRCSPSYVYSSFTCPGTLFPPPVRGVISRWAVVGFVHAALDGHMVQSNAWMLTPFGSKRMSVWCKRKISLRPPMMMWNHPTLKRGKIQRRWCWHRRNLLDRCLRRIS